MRGILRREPDPAQRWLERTTDALFIVLERQRHAAREERQREWRREQERFAEGAEPLDKPPSAYTGERDDDGEHGAVTGGGWRPADWISDGAAAGPPLPSDQLFVATAKAAALACSSWRRVALGTVNRCVLAYGPRRNDGSSSSSEASGQQFARDPLAALRVIASLGETGSVLRALRVQGSLPSAGFACLGAQLLAASVVAAELGERAWPNEQRAEGEAVARALRRLTVACVDGIDSFAQALTPMLANLQAVPPPTPPRPPLLGSLVSLELRGCHSRYDPNASAILSHANLPSLRSLRAYLTKDSECPLDLGDDPARLTQLLVLAEGGTPPFRSHSTPPLWPQDESLLLASRSVRALLTLEHLKVGRTWAYGTTWNPQGYDVVVPGDPSRPPLRLARSLRVVAGESEPLPPGLKPASRLLTHAGLGALTRLSYLSLSADYDFGPALVSESKESNHARRDELNRERQVEARAGARSFCAALAPSLRRLELLVVDGAYHHTFSLPPSLSLLTSLTELEIRHTDALLSVGMGVRRLVRLRRLAIVVSYFDDEESHPPMCGDDLRPLTNIQTLLLSYAPSCVAEPIEHALASLQFLGLEGESAPEVYAAARVRLAGGAGGGGGGGGSAGRTLGVYRRDHDDLAMWQPMTAADLQQAVETVGDMAWDEAEDSHQQLVARAEEEARLDEEEAAAAERQRAAEAAAAAVAAAPAVSHAPEPDF
jgi:hypothetical protein